MVTKRRCADFAVAAVTSMKPRSTSTRHQSNRSTSVRLSPANAPTAMAGRISGEQAVSNARVWSTLRMPIVRGGTLTFDAAGTGLRVV